jgi:RNA polymerase sigma-32 factor
MTAEPVNIDKKHLDDVSKTCGDLSLPLMQMHRAHLSKSSKLEKSKRRRSNRHHTSELAATTDPLKVYLSQLKYIEPLPAHKQQELAERFVDDGDLNAAKMLVLTNLRLVVKLAREYQRRWTNLLDLIQEGNVGLSEAVKRYDPYRGVKFSSYAQYWIRAMILNYLMNHLHPVKIGSSRAGRKLFYNLKKTRRQIIRQGHEPTTELIADYLDVDPEEVVRIAAQLDAPPVFLDAPAPGYGQTTVGELMASDTIDPESAYAERDMSSQIQAAIDAFGEALDHERDQAIWFARMIAQAPKSLAALGDDWGVSKERIRQVEVQIREAFKHYLLSRMGDDVQIDWLESN